jgi:membrane peptidoglycan carboxypeptidase
VQAATLDSSTSVYGYDSTYALPIAVVEPGTGHIYALAVNRQYSLDKGQQNTVNQLIAAGGGVNGYQAGSTFKMFTMLAALEMGKTLDTVFNAPARFKSKWPASGNASCDGYYCPANANPSWMDGPRTMWTGFGRSVNTYFVWLLQQIGPQRAVAMAKRLGIQFRSEADADLADGKLTSVWGSFTLGVSDTSPLDLANAYAAVANDGIYCKPLPVLSITDSGGRAIPAANPACHRVVSADIARAATDAARCPVGQQSAYGSCDGGTAPEVGAMFGGRPVAGKTGSSENNATESFAGFTPQVAAAGIAANPANPSDGVGEGVSSSVNMAVARAMSAVLKGQPIARFKEPSADIAG